jgi:sterol 14-demethylase
MTFFSDGLLFLFSLPRGLSASWLFTFLSGHQDWRSRAVSEMESLLDKYSPLSTCKEDSSSSLSLRLGAVPLEAWENEVPVLDAIIRETTRLAQPHTAMRRNVGPELYINNKIVPTDAYVVYPFSDVHLDPEIYPDPWRFDPGRKEANHAPFAYLGWGGGKENPSFLSEVDAYSFSQEKRPALARV